MKSYNVFVITVILLVTFHDLPTTSALPRMKGNVLGDLMVVAPFKAVGGKRSAMLISKFVRDLQPGTQSTSSSQETDADESLDSEFSKRRFSRCYFNVASCFTKDY